MKAVERVCESPLDSESETVQADIELLCRAAKDESLWVTVSHASGPSLCPVN